MPRKPDIPPEIANALEELHLRLQMEPGAPSDIKIKWYREAKANYGPRTCKLALALLEAHTPKNQVVNYYIDKNKARDVLPLVPSAGAAITSIINETRIADPTPSAPLVVITLHGIKTRGVWQKDLVPILHDAGYKSVPIDYGRFLALQMLIPRLRQRKIDWFRDKHDQICDRERVARPSIIAHSFGTYLVARAMQKYQPVKFDRVIFCGSIVQKAYPWNSIFDNDQVRAILNDFGRMDFWAGIVTWCVEDAGPSGREGFSELAGGRVKQIDHPEFRHGDYFFVGNYKESWIPFLQAEPQTEIRPAPKPVPNSQFRVISKIVMIAVIAFILLVISYFI